MHTKRFSLGQCINAAKALALGLCVVTAAGCSQTADPSQGGLFGWSQGERNGRLRQSQSQNDEARRTTTQGVGAAVGGVAGLLAWKEISSMGGIALVGAVASGSQSAATASKSAPFGTLVEDGKIISPYAKDKPPITIPKALAFGNVMKCPYTRKFFRVPHRTRTSEAAPSSPPSSGPKKDGAITRSSEDASASRLMPARSKAGIQNEPPKLPDKD